MNLDPPSMIKMIRLVFNTEPIRVSSSILNRQQVSSHSEIWRSSLIIVLTIK